jgi:D-alanyl-lipoteichoic acid acyltransferase DltB (MBOAT superfamily)
MGICRIRLQRIKALFGRDKLSISKWLREFISKQLSRYEKKIISSVGFLLCCGLIDDCFEGLDDLFVGHFIFSLVYGGLCLLGLPRLILDKGEQEV